MSCESDDRQGIFRALEAAEADGHMGRMSFLRIYSTDDQSFRCTLQASHTLFDYQFVVVSMTPGPAMTASSLDSEYDQVD
jgi:hypothetical protein